MPLTPWIVSIAAALSGASSSAPADPVADAAAGAISRLGLQSDFPRDAVAPDTTPWSLGLPDWLIWLGAAGVFAILFYILRDMIPGLRGPDSDEWSFEDRRLSPILASAEGSLAAADRLAGEGRVVEAMHVLLLYSLTEIRRGLRVEFADSLTSREIVQAARLPEAGRAALDGIVARVETSYFGDHPAEQADYASCRGRFVTLQAALENPAAA
jgi:hypothetical protein